MWLRGYSVFLVSDLQVRKTYPLPRRPHPVFDPVAYHWHPGNNFSSIRIEMGSSGAVYPLAARLLGYDRSHLLHDHLRNVQSWAAGKVSLLFAEHLQHRPDRRERHRAVSHQSDGSRSERTDSIFLVWHGLHRDLVDVLPTT